MRVVVYRGDDGDWRWTVKAPNGEIVADSSEGYRNKAHAVEMAARLFPDYEQVVEE